MTPLLFVWPYAVVFWAVVVWAFSPEFGIIRRARRSAGVSDARSLQVILYGGQAAFLIGIPLAWFGPLQFPPALRPAAFFAGVALLVAGSLLRRHCFRMLGTSFTGDVRAAPGQEIVTRGAYALLRHPSYTAGILMNTAFGLALGSWGSALVFAAGSLAVYMYRIRVEERALLAVIGEPYERFMRTRKRLVPFVY